MSLQNEHGVEKLHSDFTPTTPQLPPTNNFISSVQQNLPTAKNQTQAKMSTQATQTKEVERANRRVAYRKQIAHLSKAEQIAWLLERVLDLEETRVTPRAPTMLLNKVVLSMVSPYLDTPNHVKLTRTCKRMQAIALEQITRAEIPRSS